MYLGEYKDLDFVNDNSLGNNIGVRPMWINPLEDDLRLQAISQLIDAGPDGFTDYGARQYNTVFLVSGFIKPEVVDKYGNKINVDVNDFGDAALIEQFTDTDLRDVKKITIKNLIPGDDAFTMTISRDYKKFLPRDLDPSHIIGEVTLNDRVMKTFTLAELPETGTFSKSIDVDITPPSTPRNSIANIVNNDVVLTWGKNIESDMAGYLIYRSSSLPVELTAFNQIASVDKEEISFTDIGSGEISMAYAIVAMDSAGNHSLSNESISAYFIYVDDNGSDKTGDGSINKPFATIGKAKRQLPSNPASSYIISIFPGEYKENVFLGNPKRKWTSTNRLSFKSLYELPESLPLWRAGAFSYMPCLTIQNEDFVTIEGIRFMAGSYEFDKKSKCGKWHFWKSKYCKHYCNMPFITKNAISLRNSADNITVKRCFFLGEKNSKLLTGIDLGYNTDSLNVENWIFSGLSNAAITNSNSCSKQSGFTVINNTFYKCGCAISFIGRYPGFGYPGEDFVFANNIVMSSTWGFTFKGPFTRGGSKINIYNSVFFDLKRGIVINPYLKKSYVFTDTLMQDPLFALTDEKQFSNPDFMKPTLPAVLTGGLSIESTPSVDFFNMQRQAPVTIGAVEGSKSELSKKILAKAAVDKQIKYPTAFKLNKSFPNPFRYATTINYEIPLVDDENVGVKTRIRIYSINGRLIKTLVNGKVNAGYYTVSWDGSGNGKETIPVGMYICRMESGKFADSKRLLLLK